VTVRHVLIGLNLVAVIAIAGYLIWAVLSPKRAPDETLPANLTEFYPDEELEGRRLERVQGWALLFAAVVAVALPLYWLHEPARQSEAINYFDENAAERGEVLFSNAAMPKYESATSLQCANCHGLKGQGGPVPFQVPGEGAVVWHAPPLNTVLLRLNEDPDCINIDDRATLTCAVTDVITNGRPGTPMQPWGVDGGGPKNDQSIQDLVAYIRSIQLTPEQAQAQAAKDLETARGEPAANVKAAYEKLHGNKKKNIPGDLKTLDGSREAAAKALGKTGASDSEVTADCKSIIKQITDDPAKTSDRKAAIACGTFIADAETVEADEAALAWTRDWLRRRQNVQDGQLLFELNCARCHTAGWSTFDPTVPADQPGGVDFLGLPGGGGGLGGGTAFNLRDNDEIRRFGTDEAGGFAAQVAFVTSGSLSHKPYGNGGIGTGRMPGFARMLTKSEIEKIVSYERYCLDTSTFLRVDPICITDTKPRVEPTSTTKAKG
jgi:mono/diheme cytochrome c family protein